MNLAVKLRFTKVVDATASKFYKYKIKHFIKKQQQQYAFLFNDMNHDKNEVQ